MEGKGRPVIYNSKCKDHMNSRQRRKYEAKKHNKEYAEKKQLIAQTEKHHAYIEGLISDARGMLD